MHTGHTRAGRNSGGCSDGVSGGKGVFTSPGTSPRETEKQMLIGGKTKNKLK